MDFEIILKKLKGVLSNERYQHSLNVMETSINLAAKYGIDLNKAKMAGILHDCGKNYKGEMARKYVKNLGYKADYLELRQTQLLHGIIGEDLAKTVYEITDSDILSAIRWHTTGRPDMTTLEKIIYVADYIEPMRDFKGIEDMRKLANENLDKCIILCANSTIRYILDRGFVLHEMTVATRNHSVMLLQKEKI